MIPSLNIKPDFITDGINILNKLHGNILNVSLMRSNDKLETTAFRKETKNDKYLHRRSFVLITWKNDTLRTLIRRAYTACSNDNLLQKGCCPSLNVDKSVSLELFN